MTDNCRGLISLFLEVKGEYATQEVEWVPIEEFSLYRGSVERKSRKSASQSWTK